MISYAKSEKPIFKRMISGFIILLKSLKFRSFWGLCNMATMGYRLIPPHIFTNLNNDFSNINVYIKLTTLGMWIRALRSESSEM